MMSSGWCWEHGSKSIGSIKCPPGGSLQRVHTQSTGCLNMVYQLFFSPMRVKTRFYKCLTGLWGHRSVICPGDSNIACQEWSRQIRPWRNTGEARDAEAWDRHLPQGWWYYSWHCARSTWAEASGLRDVFFLGTHTLKWVLRAIILLGLNIFVQPIKQNCKTKCSYIRGLHVTYWYECNVAF